MKNKILSWIELKKQLESARKKKKKIVFTNGCFDLVHAGHAKVFEWARKQGDVLVVGLNSDDSVRRLKGAKRPIVEQKERALLLAAFGSIDFIAIFKEDTPAKLIELVQPDVLVKGGDWKKSDIVGADIAKKVVRIPLMKGLSTTNLVEKIRQVYGQF